MASTDFHCGVDTGVAWLVVLSGAPGWASLLALALFWWMLYGIDASRAFMPDPLMTGLLMLSLALLLRMERQSSPSATLLMIAALGAACYVKPMAGVMAAPAVVLADLAQHRRRGLIWATGSLALAAAPAILYYLLLLGESDSILVNRYFPGLWVQQSFWLGWMSMIDRVIGGQALLVALASVVVAPVTSRRILTGAWLGYGGVGLVFPHHIHTHDYYSLPLIPLAAMSLGAGLPALLSGVSPRHRGVAGIAVGTMLVLWTLRIPDARSPWGQPQRARLRAADYARIGSLVQHSGHVATLDGDYGYPLAYYGLIGTKQLTLSIDRSLARLSGQQLPGALAQLQTVDARYFVGTVFAEVAAQPELQHWLTTDARLIEMAGGPAWWRYAVWDLGSR
jgi:4-amino-4-deoxy-L-arabinose transferase-like glycosyltransferase